MSPSGRLRLLTILGLILPSRGQTLEEATSISTVDPTTLGTHVLTQVPDTVHPEVQSTPETRTLPTDETQQPTGRDVLLVTDPGTLVSSEEDHPTEGTTELPGRPSPGRDARTDPLTPGSSDSDEDNPFYYDVTTLRRRGLLVAAVLFITGIIILTSGKCRQLSQLCGNRRR
uniref:FXYD domain-containing ion transport regulator n=1 Tax=Sciurus vulgaris TaxID=55149 RepID=A0A8D2JS44_SCIVU